MFFKSRYLFSKTVADTFWVTIGIFGLLFIPISGHTGCTLLLKPYLFMRIAKCLLCKSYNSFIHWNAFILSNFLKHFFTKNVNGVLGIRTRDRWMVVGTDESVDLWRPLYEALSLAIKIKSSMADGSTSVSIYPFYITYYIKVRLHLNLPG